MQTTRILQLSDLHLFCDSQMQLHGIPTRKTLQTVVDHIQKSGLSFEHLVITGDHTHDEQPDSYHAVLDLLAPWLDRTSIVPGNHDDRDIMHRCLGNIIRRQSAAHAPSDGRINFVFDCGHWLCVGLDTHSPGNVSGQLGTRQINWLQTLLRTHAHQSIILFCHHPPMDVGSEWMDAIGLTDRDALVELINDSPRIQLIVCGHVHHEFNGTIGAARVVSTPSTGIQFDTAGKTPQFAADPPGYRWIELQGANVQTRVVRLPRTEYDPTSASP